MPRKPLPDPLDHLVLALPATTPLGLWRKILDANRRLRRAHSTAVISVPKAQLREIVMEAFRQGEAAAARRSGASR